MSDFLRNAITHAGIQDNLLQTYRTLSISLQSLLLAIGIFLTVTLLDSNNIEIIRFYLIPIYLIFIVAVYISQKFMDVIGHRGKDVSFWHKQIIALAQEVGQSRRYFTKFKVSQKNCRNLNDYLTQLIEPREEPLNKDEIHDLIGRGMGHTRKVLDRWIPFGIRAIWAVIVIVSTYYYWLEITKEINHVL